MRSQVFRVYCLVTNTDIDKTMRYIYGNYMCVASLEKNVFFVDRQTSNNVPFGAMSYNISIIFDRPTICRTAKHVDQSETYPGVY